MAIASVVKWKRTRAQSKHERQQEEAHEETLDGTKYHSRMIEYTRCGHQKQTRRVQLRTSNGYRVLHCQMCHKHERCSHNTCLCKPIWHQCETRRIDPAILCSRKSPAKKASSKSEKVACLESTRKAPLVESNERKNKKIRKKASRSRHWPHLAFAAKGRSE